MGNLIWILTRWPESTERAIIRLCLCYIIFINFKVMYRKLKKMSQFQKQPPELLYRKSCSSKFCNIHRKTPKLESPFNRLGASILQLSLKGTPTQVLWILQNFEEHLFCWKSANNFFCSPDFLLLIFLLGCFFLLIQ